MNPHERIDNPPCCQVTSHHHSASGRSRTATAQKRVVYSHLGSPMPSRRACQIVECRWQFSVAGHSSCGGRNRTHELLVQSQASLPTATTPQCIKEGRAGLEPARWYLTGTCSAAELPTHPVRKSALRESNPPCQVGSLEPYRSAKSTRDCSGRRGSRTLKAR